MAYHGHTSQVEFRFTNLWEERLGADIALAAFPESFGTEALLFLGDLDATRPVQVVHGLFVMPRVGVGVASALAATGPGAGVTVNLGAGVIARVVGRLALRRDFSQRRFLGDLGRPLNSLTVGAAWLRR